MKTSKERKMDRKINHKALTAAKTFKSRQRRLDNKDKRDKIHAIDPDVKINMIDQIPYTENGWKIEIVNNKLHFITNRLVDILEDADPPIIKVSTVEEVMEREGIITKIETKNRNAIQRLTDKLRRK